MTPAPVEAAGIEPASREVSAIVSTHVVDYLVVALEAPIDRLDFRLTRNVFNNDRARHEPLRFGIGDRFSKLSDEAYQPGLRFLTQPMLDFHLQLKFFGQLLTRPTDQPRYATRTSNNPVESNSPPISIKNSSC